MQKILILSLLATVFVPVGAATCVADVCATTYSYGDGCTSGEAWDDAGRGVSVDSGDHHVYASNACYVFNMPGYSEEGSHVNAGYYECCENGYRTVGVSWYGYTWNGHNECSYTVYAYGMEPVPNGGLVDPVACLNGPPGLILP